MAVYQIPVPVSPPTRQYRPVREMRIASNGALLAAGEPRYDSLAQYISQFAAPLSQLAGVGWWSFYDPIHPEVTLLLQCEPEAWCERCHQPLNACECPF